MRNLSGAGAAAALLAACRPSGLRRRAGGSPDAAKIEIIADAKIDRWDPAMDAIVPKDWKIEKLAEGFGWAEGPIWVRSGNYLLFTDVPGNKMWKWSEKGGLEKFLDPSGAASSGSRRSGARPAPTAWRSSTRTASCSRTRATARSRGSTSRRRQKTPVATMFDGKKLSSPNDVDEDEERRAVLHRSAVRLQEVRRRAGEGDRRSTACIAWATDGKVTRRREGAAPAERRRALAG